MKTINTKGLDIGGAAFFVPSHGDCLDSPSSPMRIHEGDIIGLHDIEIKKVGDYNGKLIAVVLRRNVGGCSRFMVVIKIALIVVAWILGMWLHHWTRHNKF